MASCHGSVLVMSTLLLSSALVVFHSCWYLEASSGCTVVSLLTGIWPSKPVRAMERAAGASHGEDAQWLVVQAERNGTNRCDDGTTGRVQLFGLPIPRPGMPVQMESGIVHELLLVAFMENGTRRCGGGDFFETALTGDLHRQTHFSRLSGDCVGAHRGCLLWAQVWDGGLDLCSQI